MRRQFLIVALLVLFLRLPFLNQAIQGDDLFFLYGAEHAQIDPFHPTHARYVFQGAVVDMRGHPHPPFDSWCLAALLALFRTVAEVPFHAAYIPFSLLAAWSALALARRFSPRPLAATVLFLVTPAFVVNGNSLESDVPFAAFWLASTALFVTAVDRRSAPLLALSALALALASLTAYQAIVLIPILWLYGRAWKPSWLAAWTPAAIVAAFQLFERATSGALPAAVLTGYMKSYGLQQALPKILNAGALLGHLAWVVFPLLALAALRPTKARLYWIPAAIAAAAAVWAPDPLFLLSLALGVLILLYCAEHFRDFPPQWILIFFASALVIFFAGAARYLLPLALPLSILVSARLSPRWLYAGAACELLLSLSLATVNYLHWDAYRQFARQFAKEAQSRRVWINGDFLRFYFEREGALPLLATQSVHPGETVVSSKLSARRYLAGGGVPVLVASRRIAPAIPIRLAGLESRSAYSSTVFGLRPFDFSSGLIDDLTAERIVEKKPELSALPMNSPAAAAQIVSGVYDLENGQWRWMAAKAVLLLKAPAKRSSLKVAFYLPPPAKARELAVFLGSREVARQKCPAPGSYTLTTPPLDVEGPTAAITLAVDKTFSVPNDNRELGLILISVGFE